MEALHNSLGSLPSLHPLSSFSASTRTSSFTPLSSLHSPFLLDRPLHSSVHSTDSSHGSSYKLPTLPNTSASQFSAPTSNPKSLILMRRNAAGGYAAALANIGQSNNILDEIHADLQKLGSFLEHRQLHSFLTNPNILDTHKKGILNRLAEDFEFVPYTLNLLNLIIDRQRTEILKDVVMEFECLYNQIMEMEVSIILSAVEINVEQLGRIARKIQGVTRGKDVRLADSSLIAGFIVKYSKEMVTT